MANQILGDMIRGTVKQDLRRSLVGDRLANMVERGPRLFVDPGLPPPPPPAPPPPVVAPTPPAQVVPLAPVESPFDKLPFPSPGDRIKADDFKSMSQSIMLLYDLFVLSSSLFGRPYGDVRLILGSRGYEIARVITVFGSEVTNLADTSLDARKVLHVGPAAPGHPQVTMVLSEATDTRRFMPNLVDMSYRSAQSHMQSLLGDVALTGAPPVAPQVIGLDLAGARDTIPK